jgi:hypothetical protein
VNLAAVLIRTAAPPKEGRLIVTRSSARPRATTSGEVLDEVALGAVGAVEQDALLRPSSIQYARQRSSSPSHQSLRHSSHAGISATRVRARESEPEHGDQLTYLGHTRQTTPAVPWETGSSSELARRPHDANCLGLPSLAAARFVSQEAGSPPPDAPRAVFWVGEERGAALGPAPGMVKGKSLQRRGPSEATSLRHSGGWRRTTRSHVLPTVLPN